MSKQTGNRSLMASWDSAVWWAAQWGFAFYAERRGEPQQPSAEACRDQFWRRTRSWNDRRRLEAIRTGWPDCPAEVQDVAVNAWEMV